MRPGWADEVPPDTSSGPRGKNFGSVRLGPVLRAAVPSNSSFCRPSSPKNSIRCSFPVTRSHAALPAPLTLPECTSIVQWTGECRRPFDLAKGPAKTRTTPAHPGPFANALARHDARHHRHGRRDATSCPSRDICGRGNCRHRRQPDACAPNPTRRVFNVMTQLDCGARHWLRGRLR